MGPVSSDDRNPGNAVNLNACHNVNIHERWSSSKVEEWVVSLPGSGQAFISCGEQCARSNFAAFRCFCHFYRFFTKAFQTIAVRRR